jgi:hypothetical protein
MPRAIFCTALAFLSCSGASGTDHTFKDQGKICLFPEGGGPGNTFAPPMSVTFSADRGLSITVQTPTCLSGSCDKDRQAACTATVNGQVIIVTSNASWRTEGPTCTLDCGALVANCTTPPLPAGTYLIQHGAQSVPVTIPSSVAPPCAGQTL